MDLVTPEFLDYFGRFSTETKFINSLLVVLIAARAVRSARRPVLVHDLGVAGIVVVRSAG